MMNLKKQKYFALTLAALSMFALVGCGSAGGKETQAPAETQATEMKETEAVETEGAAGETEAAQTTGTSLFDNLDTVDLEGNKVDKSIFSENELTLVNSWNVGCSPCVEEIPILDQLNKEYEGKGVGIKGLYYALQAGVPDEERAAVEEIISKAGAEYQQILVSEAMLASDEMQELSVFPTTYFVDSEGKIIDLIEGSNDYEGWKEMIEEKLSMVRGDE